MGFWSRPQATGLRRVLFQLHLWAGIGLGVYLLMMSVTGSALLFRIDMQRAQYPELFTPRSGPVVRPEVVLASLQRAYPGAQIAGVDAPTDRRPTYLAYVAQGGNFLTVLLDPADGHALGELPARGVAAFLQDLHFNLLGGSTGETINGIGALCFVVMIFTGLLIWWQGSRRWTRGLKVVLQQPASRVNRELHGAVGFWTLPLLLMWAITALSFIFRSEFRATVNAILPLTVPAPVQSRPVAGATPLANEVLIARAEAARPGLPVARVVVPYSPESSFQVLFARHSPTLVSEKLDAVHLDQYSGEVISVPALRRSAGDMVMEWAGPLHVGSFGGAGVRVLWCLLGLAPALLFVTGFIAWWQRVVRPRPEVQP